MGATLAYLTPEKMNKIKDAEAVKKIIENHLSCARLPDAESSCKKDLREIGEHYVANHLDDFLRPQ